MSVENTLNRPIISQERSCFLQPGTHHKKILIAIATILALATILTYALVSYWFVPAALFGLALIPLFPFGRVPASESPRISDK